MKRDLVLFGTGEIAAVANFYFDHDSDHRVVAFSVDGAYIREFHFCDKPVVAFDDLERHFSPADYGFFAAIGYTKLNRLRTERVQQASERGYWIASYVSSKATIFPGLRIGSHAFILEDNTIQPFVAIGDNVTLWSGNHIGHHSTVDDNCFIASHVVISGRVHVGAGSFLGVNVTIGNGVTIGRNCVLGAGTLLLKDAADGSVYRANETERSRVPSSRLQI